MLFSLAVFGRVFLLALGFVWVWVLFWGVAKAGKHKLVATKAVIRVFVMDMMCSCG